MNQKKLPQLIPIFPLSNVIFFPKTTLPLNIFEKRYLSMIYDSIKSDRLIGIVQPKKNNLNKNKPELYSIGCLGKINSFHETEDKRLIITLSGISRFKIKTEIENKKLYREYLVDYQIFEEDEKNNNRTYDEIKYKNITNKIKKLFEKKGFLFNWQEIEKFNSEKVVDTISMIAPFSNLEKQSLIEAKTLSDKIKILEDIININLLDEFQNKTLQ